MNNISLLNKHSLILVFCSIIINGLFLFFTYKGGEFCFVTLASHGEVAYNVATYNSFKVNPERLAIIRNMQMASPNKRIDYYEIDHSLFGLPTGYRDIFDTVGYGLLLGFLWKFTGSLSYLDIQILQIIIFSLLMLLIYQIALILFFYRRTAFFCGISLLLFFPLIFQNVQAHRDIWGYYGIVVLLFSVLLYLFRKPRIWIILLGGILFSIFQFIRPSIVYVPIFLSFFLLGYGLIKRSELKKTLIVISLMIATNILFFWTPFFAYNSRAYGVCFVGPKGQNLLECLGEIPNKWGYQFDDGWYSRFITNNYPAICSDQERDDKAIELFVKSVKEEPLFFIKFLFIRLKHFILPNLPWSYYPKKLYEQCFSFLDKVELARNSFVVFIDLVPRLLYTRLFLLFGYIGMIVALFKKRYFTVLLLSGVILLSYLVVPFHYRYLILFYWPFAFFVGYLVSEIYIKVKSR